MRRKIIRGIKNWYHIDQTGWKAMFTYRLQALVWGSASAFSTLTGLRHSHRHIQRLKRNSWMDLLPASGIDIIGQHNRRHALLLCPNLHHSQADEDRCRRRAAHQASEPGDVHKHILLRCGSRRPRCWADW